MVWTCKNISICNELCQMLRPDPYAFMTPMPLCLYVFNPSTHKGNVSFVTS
jgi:hypothetical protein